MNEKEKLEQPKLVEVEKSPPEVVESSSQCAEVENTPETSEPASAPAKPEVAAYGDLEQALPETDKGTIEIAEIFDFQQFEKRLIALFADSLIVSFITAIFIAAIMSVVVFDGGDEVSVFLKQLQSALFAKPLDCFVLVWLSSLLNLFTSGILLIVFLLLLNHFGISSLTSPTFVCGLFAILGPIIQIVYQTIFLSGKRQATIGKMITGVRIVGINRQPLRPIRALYRECICSLEFLTFHIFTFLPFVLKKGKNPQPLHDMIAGSISVSRPAGLSKAELSEFIPFGLAVISIGVLFAASYIYESSFGKIAGEKQIEEARKLFGDGSESHLRQLWRYTLKRVDAGDYNKSTCSLGEIRGSVDTTLMLASSWGMNDQRVMELAEALLKNSIVVQYPELQEKLLKIVTNRLVLDGDRFEYTPFGDLCQLYLAKIRSHPEGSFDNLYKIVNEIAYSRLKVSNNKFKLLTAYLTSAKAANSEFHLFNAVRYMKSVKISTANIKPLHWSYWDYRLYQLLLAEQYIQDNEFSYADQILTELKDFEYETRNQELLKSPRLRADDIEEKVIQQLSQEFPDLVVQLKPSYWRYSQ